MILPTLQQVLAQQSVRLAVAFIIAIAVLYFIRMAVQLSGFLTLICLGLLTYGAYCLLTEILF